MRRKLATLAETLTRRVGETSRERLRWITDFAERDLGTLHDAEVRALEVDFLFIATGSVAPSTPPTWSRAAIVDVQERLRHALRAYFTPEGFRLPPLADARLVRYRTGAAIVEGDPNGSDSALLLAVARLILLVGPAFKQCPECQRPFVAHNRQGYDSPRCSTRARERRRRAS